MTPVFFKKRLALWAMVVLSLSFSQGCSTKYIVESPNYSEYEGEINRHTRLIRAERGQVFQVLINEEPFNEVCPKSITVTYDNPPPYQVGTLVETQIEHIFGMNWASIVGELIQDTKIRLQFLDGFFAGGSEIWELESVGEYTRVTHTIIVQPKGAFRKLAWNLKVRQKHDKMVEAFLDNMKKALEKH
jgi:hypothetical protein